MAIQDTEKQSTLPADFQQATTAAAVIAPPKVMVSLPLDADLAAFFQSETEPADWQRHINGVLRFYVETNQIREADAKLAFSMAPFQP